MDAKIAPCTARAENGKAQGSESGFMTFGQPLAPASTAREFFDLRIVTPVNALKPPAFLGIGKRWNSPPSTTSAKADESWKALNLLRYVKRLMRSFFNPTHDFLESPNRQRRELLSNAGFSMRLLSFPTMAIALVLAIVGCTDDARPNKSGNSGGPAPTALCSSDEVVNRLLAEAAGKLENEGAKGFARADLKTALSLQRTVVLEKDTRSGAYRCSASVRVNYPDELPVRIADSLSSDQAREGFRAKLEERLGIVQGSGVFAQLTEALSDGPFGFVPVNPEPGSIERYRDVLRKNAESLFDGRADIPVQYAAQPATDADGKPTLDFRWQVDKRDPLDLNVVLLSLRGVL